MWAWISNTMAASSPVTITATGDQLDAVGELAGAVPEGPEGLDPLVRRGADRVLEDAVGRPEGEECGLVVPGVRVDVGVDGRADLLRGGHGRPRRGRTGALILLGGQRSNPRAMSRPGQYGDVVGGAGLAPVVAKGCGPP